MSSIIFHIGAYKLPNVIRLIVYGFQKADNILILFI